MENETALSHFAIPYIFLETQQGTLTPFSGIHLRVSTYLTRKHIGSDRVVDDGK